MNLSMEVQSDGVEPEQFSDSFLCCVCLDLLYKPVVLACGHISCFWCVHRSMSSVHESHCTICTHPYHHFPAICQMLHFLLLKMYPIAYKIRETQILEEEKRMGCFSPQIDALLCVSHTDEKQNHCDSQGQSSTGISLGGLSRDLCSSRKNEPCSAVERLETISQDIGENSCSGAVEEQNLHQKNWMGPSPKVFIADVLCAACKQLLFQPVVLNCGHVHCESCLIVPENGALLCQACQTPHPTGFPKVCLELDHFLEEQFPTDYELRKESVLLKQGHLRLDKSNTSSREAGDQDVHIGVGCDSCGMYPIIGERYRCKDCVEEIGFDFCGDCYNTRSNLPGRFNQQHTPEHKFEIV